MSERKGKVSKATKRYVDKKLRKTLETKFFDVVTSGDAIATGSFIQLNNISAGPDEEERGGNQLTGRGIRAELTLIGGASATVPHHVRFVIAEAKNPDDLETNPASYVELDKFMRQEKCRRILCDKLFYVSNTVNSSNHIHVMNLNKKFGKYIQKVDFKGPAVAKPISGRLVAYIISSTSTAFHSPQYTLSTRYYYNDA